MNRQERGRKAREAGDEGDAPITIKKYANRRLYNTATSSYVTLDHLCQMVQEGIDFIVYDAKTGDDITRSVLTQIIVEEEAKGTHLLPINFLRQLIGFYGDNMQALVPRYLEHMMASFAENQDRMRQQMQETFGGMFPFGGNLEEMGKQNAALFESAMKMFTPFAGDSTAAGGHPGGGEAGESRAAGQGGEAESLAELKRQVDLLQKQLDALTRAQGGGQRDSSGRTASGPGADRGSGTKGKGER